MPISPLASRYACVLLDLDGCIWVGDAPTPRAAEAVDALRAAGKRVAFVTNDARHGTEDFVRKLWRLGLRASVEEVVTVGGALQHALNEHHQGASAYVIGSPAVVKHVTDAGLRVVNGTTFDSRAEVVVAAGTETLVYEELKVATQALLRGAAFVGASRDRTYPMADGQWPGTGPLIAWLETASARTVDLVVGKPEPGLFLTALDRLGADGDTKALMVGDRLDVDVTGAAAAGIDGALVLSGATSHAEALAWAAPAPVAVGTDLAELILGPA